MPTHISCTIYILGDGALHKPSLQELLVESIDKKHIVQSRNFYPCDHRRTTIFSCSSRAYIAVRYEYHVPHQRLSSCPTHRQTSPPITQIRNIGGARPGRGNTILQIDVARLGLLSFSWWTGVAENKVTCSHAHTHSPLPEVH